MAEGGKTLLQHIPASTINNFSATHKSVGDFEVKATKDKISIRVIEALEGQLITNELIAPGKVEDGLIVSDVANDVLKMAVVNRYEPDAPVAVAFIKNFGLKSGALASTVAA